MRNDWCKNGKWGKGTENIDRGEGRMVNGL